MHLTLWQTHVPFCKLSPMKNYKPMLVGSLLAIAVFYFFASREAHSIHDSKSTVDGVRTKLETLELEAGQGDASAANNIGAMYAVGDGVPKDDSKAMMWFQKAAAWGGRDAQYNLAVDYERGLGVPKDTTKALEWYRKAAAQGNEAAENNLGLMYEYGEGVPKDGAKAADWLRSAAAHGSPEGELNLGRLYQMGDGVSKSFATALEWYKKAAADGNVIAQEKLADYEAHQSSDPASDRTTVSAASSVDAKR